MHLDGDPSPINRNGRSVDKVRLLTGKVHRCCCYLRKESGSPGRKGSNSLIQSFSMPPVPGVCVRPGEIALTLTPFGPNSVAHYLVNSVKAAFVAP